MAKEESNQLKLKPGYTNVAIIFGNNHENVIATAIFKDEMLHKFKPTSDGEFIIAPVFKLSADGKKLIALTINPIEEKS